MKESRKYVVKFRVFKRADIVNIARIFTHSHEETEDSRLAIKIECEDGTSYEGDSIEIFADGGAIDIKKVQSIDMGFSDQYFEKRLRFYLEYNSSNSMIDVEGSDTDWVKGRFDELKETIDAVKPQFKPKLSLKIVFTILSVILVGYGVIELVLPPIDSTVSYWTLILVVGYILTFIPLAWLEFQWPIIEFDFGPEHKKLEKRNRKAILLILSMLVIPLTPTTLKFFSHQTQTENAVLEPNIATNDIPLKIDLVLNRNIFRIKDTLSISVSILNTSDEILSDFESYLTVPGFESSKNEYRFIVPNKIEVHKLELEIDENVPPGRYYVSHQAGWKYKGWLKTIQSNAEFNVEKQSK